MAKKIFKENPALAFISQALTQNEPPLEEAEPGNIYIHTDVYDGADIHAHSVAGIEAAAVSDILEVDTTGGQAAFPHVPISIAPEEDACQYRGTRESTPGESM